MSLILEHIYCDAGSELFDHVRKETVDEFLEFVIEVMAVANELLLDRLKDICQSIVSSFGAQYDDNTDDSDSEERSHDIRGSRHICCRTIKECVSRLLCYKY